MRRTFAALYLILILLSLAGRATAEDHNGTAQLRAGDAVDVLHDGDSLDQLMARAKPLAVWGDVNAVWVREAPGGRITFVFNRAAEFGEPPNRKWVFARRQAEVDYIASLDWAFSHCEADVVESAPRSDRGSPPHAIAIARDDRHGVLYRARWGTEPTNGSGCFHTFRDVFLLRSPKGAWTFVGEGADETSGRGDRGAWFSNNVEYRVSWNDDPERPVSITATFTRSHGAIYEGPAPVDAKQDIVARREGTLDPTSREMRWSKGEYVLAMAGETVADVANRVAEWRIGYAYDNHLDRRPALRESVRRLVIDLNPNSSRKPALRADERILIPGVDDIRRALAGSPATRPRGKG